MKSTVLTLTLSLLFFLTQAVSFSQTIVPQESTFQHNDAERPCIAVTLEPTTSEVEKAWEKFLKDTYKVKLSGAGFLGMGSLVEAKEVIIPAISGKTLDFYTNIRETTDGTEMKVFGAFGYDVYINQNDTPAEFIALTKMVQKFVAEYLPSYYQKKVEVTEKELKKLNKTGTKLEKRQKKYAEKIKALQKSSEENKEELTKNKELRETKSALLKEKKTKLTTILKQISNF